MPKTRGLALIVLGVFVLAAGACTRQGGKTSGQQASAGAAPAAATEPTVQVTLIGASDTFPQPVFHLWFAEYQKLHPDIQIDCQSVGSGAAIHLITEGEVDFGGADYPMTDEQVTTFTEKRGANILHFPTLLDAVVPIYNVPGITGELNFTGDILADIYLGKITQWNDERIKAVNPEAKLPALKITVLYWSGNIGCVNRVWSEFLGKYSKEWKENFGAGPPEKWPVGERCHFNDAVGGYVQETPGALGYVEIGYALRNRIAYGSVQNANGKFIKADMKSLTAAAAGAADNMSDDLRASITDAPGDDAYPIASFTWLLIPDHFRDAAKSQAIVDFLNWMLTDGQKLTETLECAPLPPAVVEKEKKALAKIK